MLRPLQKSRADLRRNEPWPTRSDTGGQAYPDKIMVTETPVTESGHRVISNRCRISLPLFEERMLFR